MITNESRTASKAKAAAFILGLSLLPPAAVPQSAPAPSLALDRPVLLVIDIQNFYYEGGRIPLIGSVEAGLVAKTVLGAFRAKGLPVIHIQHMPTGIEKFEPGKTDPQYAIRPEVAPLPGETVVVKHFANSFRETNLVVLLKQLNVQTLVVTGMQTHMCVEAATRQGADLGYDVVLVGDACATRDLRYGDSVVPAKSVHTAVLAALNGSYARVVAAADVLAALK
jgi:nicotinamidase-related amidase